MGIFHKTHLRIPNWNVAKFTCEVKKSSSKLLVEKSMHGPSNLDHPPAMEGTGEDLLLHRGWDPEDVTKCGNFERIFFWESWGVFSEMGISEHHLQNHRREGLS